jgi:hypothetical protein
MYRWAGEVGVRAEMPDKSVNDEWDIRINPSCALQNFWAKVGNGNLTFTGFEQGPHNEARVKTGGNPKHDDTKVAGGIFGGADYYNVAYDIFADASCPIGVSPNP